MGAGGTGGGGGKTSSQQDNMKDIVILVVAELVKAVTQILLVVEKDRDIMEVLVLSFLHIPPNK